MTVTNLYPKPLFTIALLITSVHLSGCFGSSGSGNSSSFEGPIRLSSESDIMQLQLSWEGTETVDILYSANPDCDWDNYSLCGEHAGMLSNRSGGEITLSAIKDELDPDTGWYFVAEKGDVRSNQVGARPYPPAFAPAINGEIRTMEADDRLYVGGRFYRIGVATGGGTVLSSADAQHQGSIPYIDGRVHAAVPDKQGGWYLGGDFESVGGVERHYLARIRADGSIDPDWAPAINNTVQALLLKDGDLYIGGRFDEVEGKPRDSLAQLDARTGGLNPDWKPGNNWAPNYKGVEELAITNERLYAGGDFSFSPDEGASWGLAAFDQASGQLDEDWALPGDEFSSEVNALITIGDQVFAGGKFIGLRGVDTGANIISIDAASGSLNRTWDLADIPGRYVSSFAAVDDNLYVGSTSETWGYQESALSVLDLNSGTLDVANAPSVNGQVNTLAIHHGRLYLGGYVMTVNNQPSSPYSLVAVDLETGQQDPDWQVRASDRVRLVSVSDDAVFVGHHAPMLGGKRRRNLAAFDLHTGTLDSEWTPDVPHNSVNSLVVSDSKVYVGGNFELIHDSDRANLAAFDKEDGAVTEWNPIVNEPVNALALSEDKLYVGGEFTAIDNQKRHGLAAFDRASETLDQGWVADVIDRGRVEAVTVSGNRFYTGGEYFLVSDDVSPDIDPQRTRINAFNKYTANMDPDWEPRTDLNGRLNDLIAGPDNLYTADIRGAVSQGDGSSAEEFERFGLAAFHLGSGELNQSWLAAVKGSVSALTATEDRIFVGGGFEMVGDVQGVSERSATPGVYTERMAIAAFRRSDGALDKEWDAGFSPDAPAYVEAMAKKDGMLYLGGHFSRGSGEGHAGLMLIDGQSGEQPW